MIYNAVNPWAGSVMEIRRIQEEGSRFYRIDERSSTLYDCVEQAAWCIKGRRPDAALEHIRAGEKLDAANPVFEYLRGVIEAQRWDMRAASISIRRGNARGTFRIYASSRIPPNKWQSGGIELAVRLAGRIASDPHSTIQTLDAALMMADKLTWCEPSDFEKIITCIAARQAVARRILAMKKDEGNHDISGLCEDLISEGQNLRLAVGRKLTHNASESTTRAATIGSALPRNDEQLRRAAMLFVRDRQAAWVDEHRRMFLKTRVAGELGR